MTAASRAGGVSVMTGARGASATASAPVTTMPMIATSMAAGTAHRGARRSSTSHTTITGAASRGCSTSAVTGAMQIGTRMPASMAPAIGIGMRVIARPSAGHSPVIVSSTPQMRNAPTAAP